MRASFCVSPLASARVLEALCAARALCVTVCGVAVEGVAAAVVAVVRPFSATCWQRDATAMAARCGRHYISLLNLRRTPVRAVVCGASGARASALGQGEGRARREGLPNLFSESNKRVLYKDVESALQRACQGLPIQPDDCFMCASDRAHREAGDGAVLLSRLGITAVIWGADTIREISQDRRGVFFRALYQLVHRLLTTLCDSNNSRARQGSHDARAVSVRVCRPGSKTGA